MNWKHAPCNISLAERRKPFTLCLGLILTLVPTTWSALREDFAAANRLYDEGKFAEAIALYEKIEPKTAHIHFNLGNACFRANQPGRAVLHYERARRLSPRDPDILANLKFAQERLGVEKASTPPRTGARLLRTALFHRTLNEWAVHQVIAWWLTLAGVALCLWMKRGRALWVALALAGFLWFAVAAAAVGLRLARHRSAPEAVVLTSVEARFAPLPDATVHFHLREGTIVGVREDRGPWLFVRRADGQDGWVPAAAIERVGLW